MKDKTNCLTTSCDFYEYCGTLDAPIYQVRDGMITVKGQEYPIKLRDGCYIIRKLTVRECMRLQTVPETYVFPVSHSQAYKMLGNGWTVDVIAHIMGHFKGLAAGPRRRRNEAHCEGGLLPHVRELPFSRYRAVAERCSVLPLRRRRKMQGVYRRN